MHGRKRTSCSRALWWRRLVELPMLLLLQDVWSLRMVCHMGWTSSHPWQGPALVCWTGLEWVASAAQWRTWLLLRLLMVLQLLIVLWLLMVLLLMVLLLLLMVLLLLLLLVMHGGPRGKHVSKLAVKVWLLLLMVLLLRVLRLMRLLLWSYR